MNKLRLLLLVFVLGLLAAGPVLAGLEANTDVSWDVLSGGGGQRGSQHFQIDDALGQWPDGQSSSEKFQIDPGYWTSGRVQEERHTFLPLALWDSS